MCSPRIPLTSNDRDRFAETYPAIYNDFFTWFPDGGAWGASDEEIAAELARTVDPRTRTAILTEAAAILDIPGFPGELAADETNRNFANDEAARRWFERMILVIREYTPGAAR